MSERKNMRVYSISFIFDGKTLVIIMVLPLAKRARSQQQASLASSYHDVEIQKKEVVPGSRYRGDLGLSGFPMERATTMVLTRREEELLFLYVFAFSIILLISVLLQSTGAVVERFGT